MNELSSLDKWAGAWRGENRLWVGAEPVRASLIQLAASAVAEGKEACMGYVWDYEGTPQDGTLAFSMDSPGVLKAFWKDAWHTGPTGMACEGTLGEDGAVDLMGVYPAPPGADWGWQITVGADGEGMVVRMFNISPAGEAALAVEAICART